MTYADDVYCIEFDSSVETALADLLRRIALLEEDLLNLRADLWEAAK